MFTTTASAPINPAGTALKISPEQVWEGMQIRARNGDDRFVPPDHRFEIFADEGDRLMRMVHLREGTPEAKKELQRISFHGQRLMVYDFIEGPQRSVIMCFIESDDSGEYYLRHTYLTEFREFAHCSPGEAEISKLRRPMMTAQPAGVLEVIRSLVIEGVIAD